MAEDCGYSDSGVVFGLRGIKLYQLSMRTIFKHAHCLPRVGVDLQPSNRADAVNRDVLCWNHDSQTGREGSGDSRLCSGRNPKSSYLANLVTEKCHEGNLLSCRCLKY